MRPWPELAPFGRHVSTASGQMLFIFEAGDAAASALILIHGLGDEADTWRHVFGPLAESHHVIAVDLPGFGRSAPASTYRVQALRDALLGLMDALRLPSVALVGNSMGAMLAQLVALEAPERVTGLVLVDGAMITRPAAFSWRALLMALPVVGHRIYTGYRRDPRAAYESLRPFYANLDALPERDRQFLFQRVNERVWSDSQRRAYLGLYRDLTWSEPGRQRGLAPAVAGLAVPTHLIWGEQDRIMPFGVAQALRELQPAAELTMIPGAGHVPHQERPEAFLRAALASRAVQPARAQSDAVRL